MYYRFLINPTDWAQNMKHKLRRYILKMVQGTLLEGLFRNIYSVTIGSNVRQKDAQTVAVMKKVLDRKSNCIDVGAYRGDIMKTMLKIVTEGKVYGIEPIKENFDYLQRKYPNAVIFNVAVSDTSVEAEFFHVVGRPARSGLRRLSYPDPNEEVRTITVKSAKLDNLIPADVKIDFLKIDVEGAELRVLHGAEELIRQSNPVIVFEHGSEAIKQFGATSNKLYAYITTTLMMNISTIDRWLQNKKVLTQNEFIDELRHKCDFIALPKSGR